MLGSEANEGAPSFSPDGKWIAYVTDENVASPQIVVILNWFEELRNGCRCLDFWTSQGFLDT